MKHLSTHQKAVGALIIANIIWGGASPIFKYSLQSIPPFTLAFFRFGIATVLLFPFVHKELHTFTNEVENWKEIVLFALFGVTINITFFFLGLTLTQSINAPIIASSGPIITIAFSALFLKERPTIKKILGTLIAFLGVLLIIIQPLLEKGLDASILGNIFLFLATLAAVGNILVGKKIMKRYSPLPLTFWAFLIGTITFVPFVIPELIHFPILDSRAFVGVAYGALLSSAVAYSLFAWGLSKIEASEVGLFTYIDPVFAIILAYPLLGEKPTPFYLLGAILVFAGIFVAEKRIHYHPINKLIKNSSFKF